MPIEENKVTARRFFTEQDRRKGPLDAALCALTYQALIAGSPVMDMAAHGQFGEMFYEAFPDIAHIIEDTIAEESKAVVRFTLRGTHQSSFSGIPSTGKSINVSAIAIFDLVDGKITQLNAVFDQMGLLRQIEALV